MTKTKALVNAVGFGPLLWLLFEGAANGILV